MRQWRRKARVRFDGPEGGFVVNPGPVGLHEMRVDFQVSKGIGSTPNRISVTVWNLSESHRNGVGKEFDTITLEAGYDPDGTGGNVGVIATGQIRDVQHERTGADILTTLSCGDGDLAYRKATISRTFPAGTPVPDVVAALHEAMRPFGVDRGEWRFPNDVKTFKRPYSIAGSCARELDVLGRGNGFYWSVQNGALEIIPGDGALDRLVSLSAASGMVGSPILTDNGARVRCLLNPEIMPGHRVKVESDLIEINAENGVYRVSRVDFGGSNTEGEFMATVHGEAIKGGTVDEGAR